MARRHPRCAGAIAHRPGVLNQINPHGSLSLILGSNYADCPIIGAAERRAGAGPPCPLGPTNHELVIVALTVAQFFAEFSPQIERGTHRLIVILD